MTRFIALFSPANACCRKAKEADEELKKATEERSKAWKVPIADKEDEEEDQAAAQAAVTVSAHDSPPDTASPASAAISPKESKGEGH